MTETGTRGDTRKKYVQILRDITKITIRDTGDRIYILHPEEKDSITLNYKDATLQIFRDNNCIDSYTNIYEFMKETMEEKELDKEYSDSYDDITKCIEYLKEIQSRYMEQNNLTEETAITHYLEHSFKKEE